MPQHLFSRAASLLLGLTLAALLLVAIALPSRAAVPTSDFSVEVSPSALVATVKPGSPTMLELKIRNASTQPEQLKVETRSFTASKETQEVKLSETTPPDLARWVKYANPTFEVAPGAWFTQKITISLPEEAGFSYPFAVAISRANEQATDASSGRQLKGSVAVFALINVDKPGATRKLDLASFTSSQRVYEFLPTELELTLKNTGNSIVQPYGNIYIHQGSQTTTPLSILSVNETRGFILPGSSRTLDATWRDGFPRYETKNGKKSLIWDWSTLSQLRIGKYNANVVAVYNDGFRDVPVLATTSFWVIPWRIIAGALVVVALVGLGVWVVMRKILTLVRRTKK